MKTILLIKQFKHLQIKEIPETPKLKKISRILTETFKHNHFVVEFSFTFLFLLKCLKNNNVHITSFNITIY